MTSVQQRFVRRPQYWGLLLLLVLTFARLFFRLDAKDLWLDESFSLQRAESGWTSLVAGTVVLDDGVNRIATLDQHPFGYFVLLGIMLRAAGISEFALRFLSALAMTLIVPVAWSLARRLERRWALPPSTSAWAAVLAAINPFYLWFGQEVRMYALVALMALFSTYLALRWAQERSTHRRRYVLAYLIALGLLLSLHYYSVFILPVHAGIVGVRLTTNKRLGLLAAGIILALGLITVISAILVMAAQPGAGTNFTAVSLRIMIPDLVNAFTLGLSVNIKDVWPIDVLSALVMLLGVLWGLRARRVMARNAWLLPVFLAVPVLLLAGINAIRPAYMTARHLSLVSGAYLLLVSGGLAWLWRKQRWLGLLVAGVLMGGMLYSSINYYVSPDYDKGDMAGIGHRLAEQMQPGDLLLIEPPTWTRLYRYYLPLDQIEHWQKAGQLTGWRAVPPLNDDPSQDLAAQLVELRKQYKRIWLARSVYDSEAAKLLGEAPFRPQEWGFESPSAFLRLELFQEDPPWLPEMPAIPYLLDDTVFGGTIRLRGYDVGKPFEPGYAAPVTLYWQVNQPAERRYKYILRWIQRGADGVEHILATTEKEPYDALFPTTAWPVGAVVQEYTSVLSPKNSTSGENYLTLQVYDAETLQKLKLESSASGRVAADQETLILSAAP